MKFIRSFNESTKKVWTYEDVSEMIKTIKEILYELDDNDVKYKVYPNDDIKINIISKQLNGSRIGIKEHDPKEHFPINIIIGPGLRKIYEYECGIHSLPSWFIEVLFRLEEYMKGEGFKLNIEIVYFGDEWVVINSIESILKFNEFISKIMFDFRIDI